MNRAEVMHAITDKFGTENVPPTQPVTVAGEAIKQASTSDITKPALSAQTHVAPPVAMAQRVCIPGASQACVCISSATGAQSCNAAGTGLDACQCAANDLHRFAEHHLNPPTPPAASATASTAITASAAASVQSSIHLSTTAATGKPQWNRVDGKVMDDKVMGSIKQNVQQTISTHYAPSQPQVSSGIPISHKYLLGCVI